MAANFWTSSHFKQLLDQEEVDVVQPLDKERGITLEEFKLVKMQMANCFFRMLDMNVVKNISMEILDFYENHRINIEERVSAAFNI